MAEDNGPPTPRDIYLGEQLAKTGREIREELRHMREVEDQTCTMMREAISDAASRLHARHDALLSALQGVVDRAIAPLVPPAVPWYAKRPVDIILVLCVMWALLIATGAAAVKGFVPPGLLEKMWATAMDYSSLPPAAAVAAPP